MNNLRKNPVGIDVQIQKLQVRLYDSLSDSWKNIVGYGRCYKNEKESRIIPEHYIGGGEYVEVLTNDKKTAVFFFIEDVVSEVSVGCLSKNKVDLIMLVDLKKARPDDSDYEDEAVRKEVLEIARLYFTNINSVVKGREALQGFTTKDLDFIHPYFIFKITGTINNY